MFKTMRNYNKIALACCSAAFGLFALTGCEGGEIFEVNAPDWISDKVQEIEDENSQNDEDIYTFGQTDYSSGWWTDFSKYYVIPDGRIFTAEFELHINPNATNTYKNFALILTNDVDRGGEGYKEYGAIRFDHQPTGNSEWGDYIDRSYVQSNLTFETDTDEGIEKLGGKVTLTVDRTINDFFVVTMTNDVVTKTYEQPYEWDNLNAEESNTNIRCFLVVEGSYIDFLSSKIGTTGGSISADKNPVSMVLQNIPDEVEAGADVTEAMAEVTAVVTFEEDVTKTVKASELSFSAIPDIDTPGEKTLVAVYNKTFKGENCDSPIMANAKFNVVENIQSIAVTIQPTNTTYYYYTSEATKSMQGRTLAFDPTGMVVTATTSSGGTRVLDNSKLTFSTIPAEKGSHTVTITASEEITATVNINVEESEASEVFNSQNIIGSEDNTTGWWTAFSDDFKVPYGETKFINFTNYSARVENYQNFLVILRKSNLMEYAVVRADNYGWDGNAEDGVGYEACVKSGPQSNWSTWLSEMDGAKVTVYVTNCGNGTVDVQAVMIGTNGNTYIQYYLGINSVDTDDLYFALTTDGGHLKFNNN